MGHLRMPSSLRQILHASTRSVTQGFSRLCEAAPSFLFCLCIFVSLSDQGRGCILHSRFLDWPLSRLCANFSAFHVHNSLSTPSRVSPRKGLHLLCTGGSDWARLWGWSAHTWPNAV